MSQSKSGKNIAYDSASGINKMRLTEKHSLTGASSMKPSVPAQSQTPKGEAVPTTSNKK